MKTNNNTTMENHDLILLSVFIIVSILLFFWLDVYLATEIPNTGIVLKVEEKEFQGGHLFEPNFEYKKITIASDPLGKEVTVYPTEKFYFEKKVGDRCKFQSVIGKFTGITYSNIMTR